MGVRFLTVPFGPPATEQLAALVGQAKQRDALAPVTVVVADNASGVAVRRALAARRGVAAVAFVTLHRLAELLAGPRLAAAGRCPVSPPIVAGAVRSVLAEAPGLFAPVAAHPATEEALAAAYRELSGVSEMALTALSAQSDRAAEVVRVYRAARERLAAGWFDEADLLADAARGVVAGGAEGVAALGPVVVHLPRVVSGPASVLLLAIGERVDVAVVAGVTGDERADAAVEALRGQFGQDRARVRAGAKATAREPGRELGELPAGGTAAPVRVAMPRIRSVSDPDDEVCHAVRDALAAADRGVPLGRTAIVFGAADPYAVLVHEHLAAAGVPRNGASVRTIGDALLGRTLRGLLRLPDQGFRRRDVLGVLACNEIVDDAGHAVPARAWERVSRAAGVVDGADWATRLEAFAEAGRATADGLEEEGQVGRARALRADAERAGSLFAFVARLQADLAAAASIRRWGAFVQWAHVLLERYLGDDQRRSRWPDDEQHAARRVEEALDRLAGLDAIGGPPPTLDVFRRAIEAELSAASKRSGRLGEGVYVGTVSGAAGLEFDHVTVLGLAEGSFPARRLDDPLLPDREREATAGEVPLRAGRVEDDHRALLAVVMAAGEVVLSFPRGDLRRAGERTASRWLLDAVRRRAGLDAPVFTADLPTFASEPWFELVPSHLGGAARAAMPATVSDYAVGALVRDGISGRAAREHHAIAGDRDASTGVELVLARSSPRFTRFDGNLAGLASRSVPSPGGSVPSPAGPDVVVSATRLEAWASCPHRYLLEHVLGVGVVDDPERIVEISPLDRGNLVHDVLERAVLEVMARGEGADAPGSGPVWTDADRERVREIGEEVCASFERRGLTGRAVFWRHDRSRILSDLGRFVEEDAARTAAASLRPVAAEQPFGRGAAYPAVEVHLPDGRSVRFTGKVDRIDRAADGSLVVVDYKTGGASSVSEIGADDPVVRGTKLQLPLYAAAARAAFGRGDTPVHATYWFVSTEKGRWRLVGYDVTDEVDKRFVVAVAAITEGIEAGVFASRPPAVPAYGYVECRFCDPDGLGAGDRRREWERKRSDPALRAYAAMAEPGAGAGA
ncbi:MAG TPA: PD-(D/E)XK nuclease family protein [Acidimicrobiales bacterium]